MKTLFLKITLLVFSVLFLFSCKKEDSDNNQVTGSGVFDGTKNGQEWSPDEVGAIEGMGMVIVEMLNGNEAFRFIIEDFKTEEPQIFDARYQGADSNFYQITDGSIDVLSSSSGEFNATISFSLLDTSTSNTTQFSGTVRTPLRGTELVPTGNAVIEICHNDYIRERSDLFNTGGRGMHIDVRTCPSLSQGMCPKYDAYGNGLTTFQRWAIITAGMGTGFMSQRYFDSFGLGDVLLESGPISENPQNGDVLELNNVQHVSAFFSYIDGEGAFSRSNTGGRIFKIKEEGKTYRKQIGSDCLNSNPNNSNEITINNTVVQVDSSTWWALPSDSVFGIYVDFVYSSTEMTLFFDALPSDDGYPRTGTYSSSQTIYEEFTLGIDQPSQICDCGEVDGTGTITITNFSNDEVSGNFTVNIPANACSSNCQTFQISGSFADATEEM